MLEDGIIMLQIYPSQLMHNFTL